MKSFKFFFKLCWYYSVIVLFLFYSFFEGNRIFDYVFGNYSVQTMIVSDYDYTPSRRVTWLDIYGYIDGKKVYVSKDANEIYALRELYPEVFSDEKKINKIKVLKFEHSRRVMLTDDNEFSKWKKTWSLIFI